MHIISGGSDAEQARQGDYLPKDDRYARSEEYVRILRRAWRRPSPGTTTDVLPVRELRAGFRPVNGTIPVSIGGSSDEAYRVGGALGDIFGLWGEPLAETREQMDRVAAQARLAGRTDVPRTWVTFRPIVAETDELAWEKAHRTMGVVDQTYKSGGSCGRRGGTAAAERRLAAAARDRRQGRRPRPRPVDAAGPGHRGQGASTALVGSYETVAAAILDYVDLGADLISIRGYDNLNDAIDYGRYVLPLVRSELAHRESTGQRQPDGTPLAAGSGGAGCPCRGRAVTAERGADPDTSDAALRRVSDALAANAERYDRSAEFPWESIHAVHEAGLLTLGIGSPPTAAGTCRPPRRRGSCRRWAEATRRSRC